MREEIFRSYDIRGIAGKDIEIEDSLKIFKAIVKLYSPNKVAIAHDIRAEDKKMYEYVIEHNRYVDLICLGRIPTTLFYVYNLLNDIDVGVIFTASHNPPGYVGIKIVVKGKSATSEEISKIRDLSFSEVSLEIREVGVEHIAVDEVLSQYVNFLLENISSFELPQRMVVDVSNGSFVSPVIEKLLRHLEYDGEIVLLGNEDDGGKFSYHVPDTSNIENYKELISYAQKHHMLGVGFDGDGDRVLVVLPNGVCLPSEFIAYVIAKYRNIKDILVEVSTSKYVLDAMKKQGVNITMIRTGHSFMDEYMHKHSFPLGVERSGHFYFNTSRGCVEDSVLALMLFLSLYSKHEKEIMDDAKRILNYETYVYKFPIKKNFEEIINHIMSSYKDMCDFNTTDGLRGEHKECKFWFLVRKSNTEDVVRFVVEGKDKALIDKVISRILSILK